MLNHFSEANNQSDAELAFSIKSLETIEVNSFLGWLALPTILSIDWLM